MKITNKTNWNTKQFGAFVRRVAEHEHLTKEEIDQFRVTLRYRRRSHCRLDNRAGGYAYYKTWTFCISVVRGIQVDKIALAKTIAHELAHCQGVHHGKAMKNPRYGWAKGWKEVWAWAEDLPLTMNADPVKEKPKGADLALKKMEHCQKQVDVWKRKLKLAQTKVRTWNRKLRYHELRAAAMTTSKEDETTKEGVTT